MLGRTQKIENAIPLKFTVRKTSPQMSIFCFLFLKANDAYGLNLLVKRLGGSARIHKITKGTYVIYSQSLRIRSLPAARWLTGWGWPGRNWIWAANTTVCSELACVGVISEARIRAH